MLGSGAVLAAGSAQLGGGTLTVTSGETLAQVDTLNVGSKTDSGARLDVSQVTDVSGAKGFVVAKKKNFSARI